ncbi:methyl-accepting chemotaxis protein [Metabacillus fastidiosus]|uniref:methyl-accepting chemotaxis protein n=1 Tax=Metabacillus fastidiosus TaxID=1458 RepID=UPI000825E93C|nr:methyl-accepting chemotaxis protein [Metabacillus fastidiosus]MED4462626.1 methyl-accepting chemotaxis protein [Metabacillus fastidiosus]
MKIKTKLITIITVFVLAIFFVGIFASTSLNYAIKQHSLLEEKMEMQKISKHVQYRLAGLSNDERGFLLTGEKEFADGMKDKYDDIKSNLTELNKLASGHEYDSLLGDLEQSLDSYWEMNNRVVELYADDKTAAMNYHFTEERELRKETLDPAVNSFVDTLDENVSVLDKEIQSSTYERKMIIYTITIISTAVGIILGIILLFAIMRPLRILHTELENIANGNGDLTKRIHVKNKDEFGDLAASFNKFIIFLRDVIQDISSSAEHVAGSAEEFSASAQQSNASTEQISYSMNEIVNSTLEQTKMTEKSSLSIKSSLSNLIEITKKSADVSEVAVYMKDGAEEGSRSVKDLVSQMHSIHTSVDLADKGVNSLAEGAAKIDQITSLIDDISSQTNLLALNAAIEAARAGEYGKGFAVVADEVRKLAEQSHKSANEIKKLIVSIQSETEETVQSISKVKENVDLGLDLSELTEKQFTEILKATENVSAQIQEIASTSELVSHDVQAVSQSVESIANVSNETANSTEEIAQASSQQLAAIEEVLAASTSLAKLAENLQNLVHKFKV